MRLVRGMAPRAADLIRERGLQDLVVESPPRIPYVEALGLMAHAGANIVLGDTTRYYAASKLMPVLSARRPSSPCSMRRPSRPPPPATAARGLVCYGTPDVPSPSAVVSAISLERFVDLC